MHAKGVAVEGYRDQWEQAEYAARLLEVQLPPLPEADAADLELQVMRWLLGEGTATIQRQLDESPETGLASLAELATKSHALLLTIEVMT